MSDPENIKIERKHLKYFFIISFFCYLVWWGLVELIWPASFNPIGSRFFVSLLFIFFWILTLKSSYFFKKAYELKVIGLFVMNIHYYYLLYGNQGNLTWVIGSFLAVFVVSVFIETIIMMFVYSTCVILASGYMIYLLPQLKTTVFLPGNITIIIFAFMGLMQRLKSQSELKQANENLNTLLDASTEGILLHENGIIKKVNKTMSQFLEQDHSALIGQNINTLLTPLSFKTDEKIYLSQDHFSELYLIKNEKKTLILNRKNNVFKSGREKLEISIFDDMTLVNKMIETQVLYETSQNSIQLRDEFISLASHELKTPLTTLKLQNQLFSRTLQNSTKKHIDVSQILEFLSKTEKQFNKLQKLMERMLDVSLINNNKFFVEFENINLSQLINNSVELFADELLIKKIDLKLDVINNVFIQADGFRIEQLIVNLVSNAIKYGNEKPIFVKLSYSDHELAVKIEVSDQGFGIAPEKIDKIFDRFERGNDIKFTSGLGLGLYICKEIVKMHNGQIKVMSQLGQGSQFIVELPVKCELNTI